MPFQELAAERARAWFDFYGLGIEVTCGGAEIVEQVRRDFAYFHRAAHDGERFTIRLHLEAPSFEGPPDPPAAFCHLVEDKGQRRRWDGNRRGRS